LGWFTINFMNMKKIFIILTAIFILLSENYGTISDEVDETAIKDTVTYLSKLGSRYIGYPGWKSAEEYIYKKFVEIGLTDIKKELFELAAPIDEGCSITFPDGKSVKIHPFQPNGVRTSTVRPEGIKGELIYGGNGDYKNLNGKEIKDKIVLLDLDSGKKWIDIAQLGAKAFIFIGNNESVTKIETRSKYTNVPLNVPRFFITKEAAQPIFNLLKKGTVEVILRAKVTWRKILCSNIFGYIKGTDKKIKDEIVIIATNFNSYSDVPSIAPGAENACSLSAMLEIAKIFRKHPPKRTILFLATGGDDEGIEEFLYEHFPNKEKGRKFTKVYENPIIPKFFIGIDITSQEDRLGIFCDLETGGNLYDITTNRINMRSHFANYCRCFDNYADKIKNIFNTTKDKILVDAIYPSKGKQPSDLCNQQLINIRAFRAGITAFSLATMYDYRLKNEIYDTVDKINFRNIIKQIKIIIELLNLALNDSSLSEKPKVALEDMRSILFGRAVYFNPKESYVPDTPLPNAICYHKPPLPAAQPQKIWFKISDDNGYFRFIYTIGVYDGRELEAYVIDENTGEIIYAPDRGINGSQTYPRICTFASSENRNMVVLFRCESSNIFDFIDPQYLTPLNQMDVLSIDDSIPSKYGYILSSDLGWTSWGDCYGVVFIEPGKSFKILMNSNAWGKRILLLNSLNSETESGSKGIGFTYSTSTINIHTVYQSAKDIFTLNEYRIQQLTSRGIKNEFLINTHNKTKLFLEKTEQSRAEKLWDKFITNSLIALGNESRLYPEVIKTMRDVVYGVIFYMFLILPFSYFMEKLLFGFADINKRIIAISLIFLFIYFTLRIVHPVFTLIKFPEVILLGFITLTLSFIVFFIISSQFEQQMGKIRLSRAKGIFSSDVSRMSTMGVAFSLGISNMKRRRIRTLLTSVTIVFLTFAIISFTSIKTNMKYTKTIQNVKPLYQGFLIKDPVEWPINHYFLKYIKSIYQDRAIISPRGFFYPVPFDFTKPGRPSINILSEETNKDADAYNLIGMTTNEKDIIDIETYLIDGSWFNNDNEQSCILSDKIFTELKCSIGSSVRICGKKFKIRGVFNSNKLRTIKDLDNESLTVPDMKLLPSSVLSSIQLLRNAGLQEKILIEKIPKIDWSNIVVLPFDTLMSMKGDIYSIAVKFNYKITKEEFENELVDLISRLKTTIYAGYDNEKYVYSSLQMVSIGGMSNLIILIIIGGLIILNTMLGSVYERIKEIGIYSAVGLTPRHVSMLFLGESAIYSILGAIVGYLLGQIAVKLMIVFNIFHGLNLNYSSLSAVFATIMIMLIVFLSALFPAKKASELSVPDITRKWVLPKPKQDEWIFEFPFTVSGLEVLGLFTFLKNFFAFYTEESIGKFYTTGAKLSTKNNEYFLNVLMWLAPYDLGIKQEVEFRTHYTGESNIYEIILTIKRIEGNIESWERSNRYFLNMIRKEFLIWRTLDKDTKEEYRKEGELITKSQQEK